MNIDYNAGKRIVEQKEKECEICGALLVVTQHNRKYCDKCRVHPETEKRHLKRAYRDSYARFTDMEEPELVNVVCAYCGKEKTTLAKAAKDPYFCNNDCKIAFNKEHNPCMCCGKSLKDSPLYDGIHWYTQFCNQNCHDTYLLKRVEEKKKGKTQMWGGYDIIHICEGCGKPFVRNDTKARFCSQECYKETQRRKKAARPLIVKECAYCKKTFSSETEKTFCSRECYMAAIKEGWKSEASLRWEAQVREEREGRQKERDRAKKEKDEKIKAIRPKEGEQLCATCKVSYKDCERMQSNFRVLPKGAHYNSAGVLTVCPKYKPYNKNTQSNTGEERMNDIKGFLQHVSLYCLNHEEPRKMEIVHNTQEMKTPFFACPEYPNCSNRVNIDDYEGIANTFMNAVGSSLGVDFKNYRFTYRGPRHKFSCKVIRYSPRDIRIGVINKTVLGM